MKKNKGVVLIGAYLIIVILLILGGAFIVRSLSEKKAADNQRNLAQALNIAEAGLEDSLYNLRQDFVGPSPSYSWIDGQINGINVTIPTYPGSVEVYYPFVSNTVDNGRYDTYIKYVFSGINAQPDEIWVKSVATVSGVSRTIQEYAKMRNLSPWNNAIFAGTGASGTAISGNVSINGSVHILGNNLSHDQPAIDISGTGSIGNNYEGIPADLSSRIPDCPRVNFNGELIDSLSAEVRVKNGRVDISGTATIGQASIPGNTYKETIDGLYIDVGNYDGSNSNGLGTYYDGFGGNKGPAGVSSDNGTTHNYDLGNTVSFPSLSDPYQTWATYHDYLIDIDVSLNVTPAQWNGVINAATPSFSYSDPEGNISWNSATQQLTINGIIYIEAGSLDIGEKNMNIEYNGSGTIYVTDDINVHSNLLSNGIFPTTDALGLIAGDDMSLAAGAGDAQLEMIGAFYAEGKVTSAKQNQIAGTLVSNYFDLGSNVPKIYQVPSLIDNLPPGMPSGSADWILVTRGWMEL